MEFKVFFWDFDGVIINSNRIREEGFMYALANYPFENLESLLSFHRDNGGLSRYVKFRYFFEKIRNEFVSDEKIIELAFTFSSYVTDRLCKKELLISEVINYIANNYKSRPMHIVSGSDQDELRHICNRLAIDHYFVSIHGSPRSKNELVKDLIECNKYQSSEVVLIGDSLNDYEAARVNQIDFFGYNNMNLKYKGLNYIESMNDYL